MMLSINMNVMCLEFTLLSVLLLERIMKRMIVMPMLMMMVMLVDDNGDVKWKTIGLCLEVGEEWWLSGSVRL